ncbi:MAG: hypothetical protein HZB67_04730 [Candidatus Aenigmarchaeota archaeon]|nr:hypothetical protein [Candidatus Aenigmarchaeota archaeon]
MALGFIGFLFSWRRKVYILRRKYDRAREKVLKNGNTQKRLLALKILDNVEPTLIMLEEQRVSRFDRGRFISQVKTAVEQAKNVLKGNYAPQQQYPVYETRRPIRSYR